MSNILRYKGYFAKVDFDLDDKLLFGKIEGISDLITFESNSAEKIEKEFENAVDDYLVYCKEIGKKPEKPYIGQFNVRISPELHKKAALEAFKTGVSLNAIIAEAVERYFSGMQSPYIVTNNFYQTVKSDDVISEKYCFKNNKIFL